MCSALITAGISLMWTCSLFILLLILVFYDRDILEFVHFIVSWLWLISSSWQL